MRGARVGISAWRHPHSVRRPHHRMARMKWTRRHVRITSGRIRHVRILPTESFFVTASFLPALFSTFFPPMFLLGAPILGKISAIYLNGDE